ncbi:MAG: hypothetical protein FWD58_04380 [Firmicutes bacterium]|nr:hypothetical protein [Bacillota bacterium]
MPTPPKNALAPLLEYQQTDIALKKLLAELNKNPEVKKLDKTKEEFSAAKQAVSDSETEAAVIVAFFKQAEVYYAESTKKIEELQAALAAIPEDELAGRKELVSQLESTRDRLSNLERKVIDRRKSGEAVVRSYRDAQDRGKKLKENYAQLKERIDAFKKDKEPKIEALQKKLASMRTSVDPALLERYRTLAADGKYPPVAESKSMDAGKTFTCLGCGLSISQASKSELLQGGFSNCDNCRRMIYKI